MRFIATVALFVVMLVPASAWTAEQPIIFSFLRMTWVSGTSMPELVA
jgi:hypothetical protein